MSVGVRRLSVLGEFKPFGLIAEALDGKPPDNLADKYDYFLFDPKFVRDRAEADNNGGCSISAPSNCSDHELFIRGNRIIWTTGARVFKRFTLPSQVITVCWCHIGDISEALLCVLQIESLTIYNTSGEVVSIPLPRTITSIWTLPFGLLLQSIEGNFPAHAPFPSSSRLLGARDIPRPRREIGHSPQNNYSLPSSFNHNIKGETVSMSSHLILSDLLEEPQCTHIEERGKLNIMRDFDERTIWTSDQIPLMASYNKGKMQHSVWVAEVVNCIPEVASTSLSDVVPAGVLPKQFSFRRIWQGKGAQTSASKVFLATDDDAAPIICLLLQEQKKLLALRLQSVEINNEILFDIKPDMSWSIPAVAAAPVIVTRPRLKVGLLQYTDIVVLAPDNALLLYSGKQCLCRYMLPSSLRKGNLSRSLEFSEAASVSHDLKIIGLADAVEGRINVMVNTGQIFRCELRQNPSSSLTNDCITAMAEGLSSNFYNYFLVLLWGDNNSTYLSEASSDVDSEWNSFCSIIMQMGQKPSLISKQHLNSAPDSSWEFLLNSNFHKNYCKFNFIAGISGTKPAVLGLNSSRKEVDGSLILNDSFYSELFMVSLDSLHSLYESLKLDTLRKR